VELAAPSDVSAPRFPVSIKGVLSQRGQFLLLRNERDEWELPGGKLEPGEDPVGTLVREMDEELSLSVKVGPIVDCWVYDILGRVDVLIVTYRCQSNVDLRSARCSSEHKEIGIFTVPDLANLNIPAGYVRSIRSVHESAP
jgi:8-oxo-dGTP pyrophosphatase MutT (NUDIX family)